MAGSHKDADFEFFATCLAGTEKLLADELRGLDAQRVRPLSGGVAFFGKAVCAQNACLWSRIASRILLVLGRTSAANAEALYEGAARIAWEDILVAGTSFTVRAHGTNAELRNTRFTALKVKDAVADRLRSRQSAPSKPDAAAADARVTIDVRIREAKATISLDLSGEALNRRSYLTSEDGDQAPLECSLAAAALAELGWAHLSAEGAAFADPACGTGILLAEAAAIACDQAPGLHRGRWGFQSWAKCDQASFDALVDAADARFAAGLARMEGSPAEVRSPTRPPDASRVRIAGASASSPAITAARNRIRKIGLRQAVTVEAADDACIGVLAGRIVGAAAQAARRAGTDPARALVVASNLHASRDGNARARVRADAATFSACCEASPTESRYALVDAGDAADFLVQEPACVCSLGAGRAACSLLLYDKVPTGAAKITIEDLAGGAPRMVAVAEPTAGQFAARLRKMVKERRKWAQREGITCYRVYDADLADFAVAVDIYTGAGDARGNIYLHISEYAPPASVDAQRARRRFGDVLAIAPVVCGVRPDHVFSKTRVRDKGGAQYATQHHRYATTVAEGGHLFEVDLSSRLDTGLFLDHRTTRKMIGQRASGARFCNLFAYTGSFSVYAAAGGACETVTVDMSQTYLDWARRNMAANGFTGAAHRFEKADVLQWVTEARRGGRRFDLIFVDPPTFSNSKTMGRKTWDVQRDHAELLIGISRLLSEDGQAIFSCNLRTFKPDTEKLAKYGVSLQDISAETIPEDFSRTPKIHRCYIVKRAR